MSTKNIGIIVGSLREESYNKKLAKNLVQYFPEGYKGVFIEIKNLPLYNQDYDDKNQVPEEYIKFRESVSQLDGVIFVTPEYNRSVPGVLKNAIDVGSRPPSNNKWDSLPAAVISSSIGSISGFGANHHLRQSLMCLNMPTLPNPETYLAKIQTSLNDKGEISEERTKKFLEKFINSYINWLNRNPKNQ